MTLAANELQKAIYTRLSQLSTPVHDFVPQGAALPYIMIGADTSIPWDTKTRDGQEFTCTIHVFDKAAGRKSVKAIMQDIYAALHHQDLSLTGFTLVLLRCEYSESFQEGADDSADHSYHGVLRFRALVTN